MKLHPDHVEGVNLIQAWDPQGLRVQHQHWSHSLLVPHSGEIRPWAVKSARDLREDDFAALLDLPCELIIFGSGPRLQFPAPILLRPLMARRIGLETMDTPAACRTFNILAAEGRKVLAALIWPGV